MKCTKCNGMGCNPNPKFEEAKWKYPNTDYYLSFERSIKCRACNGTGYIISNVSEVSACLKSLVNRAGLDKEDLVDIQNCIKLIEK